LAGALTERRLLVALAALCGVFYVFLGATALGVTGFMGIGGGLLLWGALAIAARSHGAAFALLAIGALPFAIATSWSVITPLIAILAVATGTGAVRLTTSPRAHPLDLQPMR